MEKRDPPPLGKAYYKEGGFSYAPCHGRSYILEVIARRRLLLSVFYVRVELIDRALLRRGVVKVVHPIRMETVVRGTRGGEAPFWLSLGVVGVVVPSRECDCRDFSLQ